MNSIQLMAIREFLESKEKLETAERSLVTLNKAVAVAEQELAQVMIGKSFVIKTEDGVFFLTELDGKIMKTPAVIHDIESLAYQQDECNYAKYEQNVDRQRAYQAICNI